MGRWTDRYTAQNNSQTTTQHQRSASEKWGRRPDEQVQAPTTQKHSWDISDQDREKMEKTRSIKALKFKGIDALREEWSQAKSIELVRLARDIRTILNDERDNNESIDTTLLSFLDELNTMLKERDTSSSRGMGQTLYNGKSQKEMQDDQDAILRAQEIRQRRTEELEKMRLYIDKMQEYVKKQEEQKKSRQDSKEHRGMSM